MGNKSKVLSSGRKYELTALLKIQSSNPLAYDHPRVPFFDDKGIHVEPDIGMLIGGPWQVWQSGQGPIDALVEVKSQEGGGSALEKMESTITRYASLSDRYEIPCIIVHAFSPGVLSSQHITYLSEFASAHQVGWISLDAATAGKITLVAQKLMVARKAVREASQSSMLALLSTEVLASALRSRISTAVVMV